MYPGIMVLICTIVQESYAALSINSYPGQDLDPIPSVKGVSIQEGSLHSAFYALGVPSQAPLVQ